MSKQRRETIKLTVFIVLVAATLTLWGYIAGVLSVSVIPSRSLSDIYREYNHVSIYEDGSYQGQDIGGAEVIGCIIQAPCDNNIQPAGGIR